MGCSLSETRESKFTAEAKAERDAGVQALLGLAILSAAVGAGLVWWAGCAIFGAGIFVDGFVTLLSRRSGYHPVKRRQDDGAGRRQGVQAP